MKTRAVCLDGTRCYLGEEEVPALKDKQFLVRSSFTLPSVGTESAAFYGHAWTGKYLGYSNVGTVAAVGSKVTKYKVGDRLHCLERHANYLLQNEEEVNCYRIPDGVSDADATFATLGTVALHLLERAEVKLGQPVVVIGQGSVGSLAMQFARRSGAGLVVAVDLDEKRRARALELGADAAIVPDKEQLDKLLAGLPTDTAPPVFMEISGSSKAVLWALEAAHLRSRIVLSGSYFEPVQFVPYIFIGKELDVVGAHQPKCPQERGNYYPYSRRFNYDFFFRAVAEGWVKVSELVDGVLKPEQIIAWYEAVKERRPRLGQPIFDWRGE